MIIVISSAKTQKYTPLTDLPVSQPPLLEKTKLLLDRCRELKIEEIQKIMKVSDKLAQSTHQRFSEFTLPHIESSASPAITTFAGDVFSEIRWQDYDREDFLQAHERVRILSGLYGALRPLDLIQPYRLEMGYKIDIGAAANLYKFWTEAVTDQLNRDLQKSGSSIVVNCASKEYSRTIARDRLKGSLLNLSFKQKKNGKISSIAIYGKRARGMFVDWFITNRIVTSDRLRGFDRGGYRFVEELSNETELVFVAELE